MNSRRLGSVRHEARTPEYSVPERSPSIVPVSDDAAALTQCEKKLLEEFEAVLSHGLGTFFEVGNALIAIRDGRLYRRSYQTFDQYCRNRWGIGRTYAWRVIAATERLKMLPPGDKIQRPTSEFQMRPFLQLEPEAFPEAWRQVIEKAKDGQITSKIIGDFIAGMASQGKPRRAKRITLNKHGGAGEVLVLLQDVKRKIETGHAEETFELLERIERLLFGG